MRSPARKTRPWTAAGWAVAAATALVVPVASPAGPPPVAAAAAGEAAVRVISYVDGRHEVIEEAGTGLATGAAVPDGLAPAAAPTAAGAATAAKARPRQCTDGAYKRTGWRISGTLKWYYNGAGAPSSVSRTASKAISTAARRLVAGHNDCGMSRSFRVGQRYAGASRRVPAVTASSCGTQDGHSVVGWKRMSSSVLAVTCAWTSGSKVVSTDIAVNTRYRWFTSKPRGCSNRYDLESVLSHEWGHAFGLGHVSLSSHGTQTMATAVRSCTTSKRTLGLGDYRGMQRIYGLR
ncbi:matrixin family metalloprotease [Spirillospora sp. CA-253888]